MYGVLSEYGAYVGYCFDQAVATFGRALESELDSISEKTADKTHAKRERVLRKWLGLPQRFKAPPGPTAVVR